MAPMPCRVLTVTIRRPIKEVYAFVADPRRLPQWAAGLGKRIEPCDDHWLIPAPHGQARLYFTAANDLGVLDHAILQPDGTRIDVPMRVVANGPDASEVIFVLFKKPGDSEEAFEQDAALVDNDLKTLRALLEATPEAPPEAAPEAPEACPAKPSDIGQGGAKPPGGSAPSCPDQDAPA